MSLLNNIQSSKRKSGLRAVIMGAEKMGKTTLACGAPDALLIPLENGYSGVNVQTVPMITEFTQVMQLLDDVKAAIGEGTFPFKSLVFDSGTALERRIHERVLQLDPKNTGTSTMETTHGGYGKGHTLANTLFDEFLKSCDELVEFAAINIIVTCHTFASKVIDPEHGEYDTWDILLHSPKNLKSYGKREMITQWADLVGFLFEPMYVSSEEGGRITKATDARQGRMLGVDRSPGYVAGNRFGMQGRIPIPQKNGWNALAEEIKKSSELDFINHNVE